MKTLRPVKFNKQPPLRIIIPKEITTLLPESLRGINLRSTLFDILLKLTTYAAV